MLVKIIVGLLGVVLLSFSGCAQHSNSPKLPQKLQFFSDAIKPVAYRMQRFAIDSHGQAYGTADKKLFKIDTINDNLTELDEFDSSIVGFHITEHNAFVISTDNDHWSEKAPCNIYLSKQGGRNFSKIKQINGGCPVWMSISSDQDFLYIGEYGPKKPNVSKNVWRYNLSTDEWQIIFTAPVSSSAHIHRVAVDPYTSYLWVTVGDTRKNRGVFLSKDQGATWTEMLDSQATGIAFSADRIYWGEDNKNHGWITTTDKQGNHSSVVFDANKFGNFAGSIYELVALPDDSVLAPVMKYAQGKNVASLWYANKENWRLLMIFESLPGQGKDTSAIAGPDKNDFILLSGFKINWYQL